MSIPRFQVQKNLTPPATIAISGSPDYVGTYGSGTTYATGDVVTYNGSSYVARQATTGNTPGDNAYWQTLAAQGNTGATGPAGASGSSGSDGVITTLTAGTNLNGGGSASTVTVNLDSDISLTSATFSAASPLIFEGATPDAHETTIAITDPTGDRTVTIPDGSGTVAYLDSSITGNAATATTATTATNVTATANNSADETVYLTFVDGATGSQGIETDTGLNYNPNSGVLTTTSVTGNLTGNVTGNTSGTSGSTTGNAATATALATARNIGGVSFDGTGNIDLPGVNTAGNQATSGNAATATALQTARNINGVSFDGTGNVTVTAAAGTLTGTELKSTVVTSSLTSVGTLSALTVSGTVTIDSVGITAVQTSGESFSDNDTSFMTSAAIDDRINAASGASPGGSNTQVQYNGSGSFAGSSSFTFASGSGIVTATGFAGALTGNVTGNVSGSSGSCTGNSATATALASARNIGGVSFDGTGNIDLPGVNAAGNQNTSGNAATATALATARAINGVDFDGTGAITVTAAAGTLSGGTLASGVTASSLTSVGTLGGLSITGALTVGVDDTGHDVKFFGATSGKYMLWDESDDKLMVSGTIDSTINPPPIVETFASQSISASGTTVTFTSSRFASAPNVMVTQANSGGGASKVPNVDNITSSSCRVFLLNTSNSFVAGDASLLVTLEV